MKSLDKLLLKCHGQALVVILWVYMIAGALLFCWLERDAELTGYDIMRNAHESVLKGLNLSVDVINSYAKVRYFNDTDNFVRITDALVNRGYLLHVQNAILNTSVVKNILHPQYIGPYRGKIIPDNERWCFVSSLLFIVTTLTTIGYGHVYPTTDLGRGIFIFYCLLAIPLMSLYLLDVSISLSKSIEKLYELYCRCILRPATKLANLFRPHSATTSTSSTSSIRSISPRNSETSANFSEKPLFITRQSKVVKHQCNRLKKISTQHVIKPRQDNNNNDWYLEQAVVIDKESRKRKLKPFIHCDTSPLLTPINNSDLVASKANHRKKSCNVKIRKASAIDVQKNRKQSRLLLPTHHQVMKDSTQKFTVEPILLIVPNFLPPQIDYAKDTDSSNSSRRTSNDPIGYLINNEARLSKAFEVRKVNVPFYFIMTILMLYLLLGTVVFCITEDYTVIQCVYCIIITLTTIGFGDIVPGYLDWTILKGRIVNVVLVLYIMGGLSLMAMTVRMMATSVYAQCMKTVNTTGEWMKIRSCC